MGRGLFHDNLCCGLANDFDVYTGNEVFGANLNTIDVVVYGISFFGAFDNDVINTCGRTGGYYTISRGMAPRHAVHGEILKESLP